MSEKKKSFFSFSVLLPWSNFIFTAIISIYPLINPINTGVFRTWDTSEEQCCAPTRKASLHMTLSIFYITHLFHSKILNWKVIFFQNCSLRVALNRLEFEKSLYVCTYVSEKLVVVQKHFITSTLSYAWDSSTVYVILFIWHLIFIMFWSNQTNK